MKEYIVPDLKITVFDFEDLITSSSINIGDKDPDGGSSDWWGD